METLQLTERTKFLRANAINHDRFASIEQAKIITNTYKDNENKSRIIQRALALKATLENIDIDILEDELIVGNRTAGIRDGVVFPEAGSNWVNNEFETLPTRPQDKFQVRESDIKYFREEIFPYWQGKTMEDIIKQAHGDEISKLSKVVKINQTDHAQGHICPNNETWLSKGPSQIKTDAVKKLNETNDKESKDFYNAVILVMEGAEIFMQRYSKLALKLAKHKQLDLNHSLYEVAKNCSNLSQRPAETFHEAVQSLWFLYTILQMESNASSFSPGRLDMHLYKYYKNDIEADILDKQDALEIIEGLFVKFNEIVYMRNENSAKFFAGFPIGFNIALGGISKDGKAFENDLTYIFLKAQEHLGLPQPNLSVRLHEKTSDRLLKESIKVIAKGSGMPQFFNDKAIIQELVNLGFEKEDADNYAIVGCVELTTQGNNLGWSDSAMFNLNKVLELTLNNGKCLITNEQLGLNLGNLTTFKTYEQLEDAFSEQIKYFVDKMLIACEHVEAAHQQCLPSPFLSSVIDGCFDKGLDVTKGGAKYNLSGIQMIQIANLADSLAALKQLVYDDKRVSNDEMQSSLVNNFEGHNITKAMIDNLVPKYGNDVQWVDELGNKWANFFRDQLEDKINYRGGKYHTGMYTVSAHVPMGENVGASPDGRLSQSPLADGGMSPVYGRDTEGPTAVLKSVSAIDTRLTTNGGLLNMKFLPEFFNEKGIHKFSQLLRAFVELEVPHIQFNVVNPQDLINAKSNPEMYKGLTIRVAGYTAYFVELSEELQNEIIARTTYSAI